MPVIDEKGQLFGRVNVVDALVVLVVVAVALAGVALVAGLGEEEVQPTDPEPDPPTRHAVVSLGTQPPWVASGVESGRNVSIAGSDLTVTDVYLTGSNRSDGVGVVLSVQYPEGFTVEDGPLRAGDTVTLATDDLRTEGEVLAAGRTRSGLPARTTSVVLTTTVAEPTADAIRAGDRFRVGDRTLATVERVTAAPTADDQRRLTVGVSLETLTLGGERRFAGRPLRVGTTVPLRTERVDGFEGRVSAVDSLEPPGERTNVTITVAWENVRPETAEELREGEHESHRGASARVVAADSEPATVVRPDSEGALVVREHPRNRDVTVTVRATARRTDSGLRFHGRPLEDGRPVSLEFDGVTVEGTVTDVETDE